MFRQVRVAACSFRPRKFDVAANGDRLEELFRQAADTGAQLAVAPEGALDGYVVMPIIEGVEPAERMHEAAVSRHGPEIERFRALACELGMCLTFGLAERTDGGVYNCAVFIDATGAMCGACHKMQLAEGYCADWWFNRLGERKRAAPPASSSRRTMTRAAGRSPPAAGHDDPPARRRRDRRGRRIPSGYRRAGRR